MVEPQTVSDVLSRLHKEGYTADFRANNGRFTSMPGEIDMDPDQVIVDKIYRFEGETNLEDEEIIFALSCPQHNIKGTYLVAFGAKMDPLDADIVQRLKRKFKHRP